MAGSMYSQELIERVRGWMEKSGKEKPCRLALLRYLFDFLADVARNMEANLMSPYNLAIVFGPNLIQSNDAGETGTPDALMNTMLSMQKAKQYNAVIEMLIVKHEEVFRA